MLSLQAAGADIIELGIPYTDPLADGPVNQAAAVRALKNGITLPDILELVGKLRKKTQIPIAFLLYFNCVLQYGVESFLADCEKAGVDGLVIPDLPYEERQQYREVFAKYDVDIIPLVTPVSKKRIAKIVEGSSGFVYCVTSTGTTGIRSDFSTDFDSFLGEVKEHTDYCTCARLRHLYAGACAQPERLCRRADSRQRSGKENGAGWLKRRPNRFRIGLCLRA